MPSVAEAAGQSSQLESVLDAGVENISSRQQVTFTLYTSLTVSQDGTLFWVASGQVLTVTGSLHYSTDLLQDEDQTVAANYVILTSEKEITEFNLMAPGQLWLGSWPVAQGNATLQVAFSARGNQFGPANLWHYRGIAVLPPMSAQIIASPADLPTGPIVSNSLPFWLAQNSFAPVYPSFLVPENVVPPYIAAHIEPDQTEALQGFPLLDGFPKPLPSPLQPTLYQLIGHQLSSDRVRLTLYGFNNQTAWQYLYSLIEYSRATDNYGFMPPNPVIRDPKRIQREITAIAQKKVIDLRVSYYQSAADMIARRLIVEAIVTTTP